MKRIIKHKNYRVVRFNTHSITVRQLEGEIKRCDLCMFKNAPTTPTCRRCSTRPDNKYTGYYISNQQFRKDVEIEENKERVNR